MSRFEEWFDEDWAVTQCGDTIRVQAPNVTYHFTLHDFLELYHRLNRVAENIYEKETWFVHDDTIINRETGEQLIGAVEDCYKLNELTNKIEELTRYKERVTAVINDEYASQPNTVWETYICNLAKKLGVDLK